MASALNSGLNWTRILAKCSPTVRKTILDTRSLHEDLRRQILEAKQSVPKLDFSYYKKELPKGMGGMIMAAEEEVNSYKGIDVDVKAALLELDTERDLKIKLSQEFLINLEQNISHLKGQLAKIETSKPVDEVTVEEVYELHPEWKEQVYQKIRDDSWAVQQDSSQKISAAEKDSERDMKESSSTKQPPLNYL